MKKFSYYLIILLTILNWELLAQNPGNIGTSNLTGWFKPDGLSLGSLTNWTSTFPTGGAAITLTDATIPFPTVVNTPIRFTSNYNKTIDFTGNVTGAELVLQNTAVLDLLNNNTAAGTGTMLCVYYLPAGRTGHMVMYREATSGSVDGIQFRNLGVSCRLALGTTDNINGSRDYTESRKPELISYHGNKSGAGTMSLFQRSRIITGGIASSTTGDVGLYFGARKSGTYNGLYDGFLSEVIFYNQNLTPTEYEKVNTYLAIKYGITLQNFGGGIAGDYRSTDARLIWDADFSPLYHNNIIGIGRDDDEALLQKQSHNFDDTARIYISNLETNNDANTGIFSNNISYVVMGDNNAAMCESAITNRDMPYCGLYSRIMREWKVTKTNFNQTVNFDFNLGACTTPATINAADIKLLVDDDGDFTTGSTQTYYNGDGSGIVISYSNPVITVSNISNLHLPDDSTKFITLIIRPLVTPITASACGSYISPSGRFTWSASGIYMDTLVGAFSCDSVLEITLNLTPTLFDTISQSICSNQSYLFNGINLNTSGIYQDTFISIGLCDSFLTLNLSVIPTSIGTINTTICSNQTYTFNGVAINTAGTYLDTFSNYSSCDSVVTLNLIVNNTSTGTINRTICSNQSYLFNGINQTLTGTYNDTLINSVGCDSFLTLNLSVNATSSSTQNVIICMNQFYLFNGINRNTAGSYLDTFTNVVGCDSIITLNLSILATASGTINANICSNQNYLFNGVNRNTSGSYLDTLANYQGCDSVITLNLTVLPTTTGTINHSMCIGDSYLFNNVILNAAGTYKDTFAAANGCDSVVTLNLTTIASSNVSINSYLCNGNTYLFNGVNITSSGVYKDTFTNIFGCDSILTLNLTIAPILSGTINTALCSGETYLFNGNAISTSGTYLDTINSILGCDSFLTLNLVVNTNSLVNLYDTICETEFILFNGQQQTTNGIYYDTLNTYAGCDSILQLNLTVYPQPSVYINAGNDTIILEGNTVQLIASGANQYLWNDASTGISQTYTPIVNSTYYVIGTDSNQCSDADTIQVFIQEVVDSSYIALPTAFSPNADGINDVFKIVGTYNLNIDEFEIFNRWGEKVFSSDDIIKGWDGTFRGREQPIATYVYVVKGRSKMSNKIRTFNGIVTLIR